MKMNFTRVIAFFLLIALSVGFGFAFDAVATLVEKNNYPIKAELADAVHQNAQNFGVPEAILWALLCTGSDFASNAVSERGAIGLMQLTPDTFTHVTVEVLGEPAPDTGLLYEPTTNLRAGSAWISHLYQRYGVWEIAFAAYYIGTDTVDGWLLDSKYANEHGAFTGIPDQDTANFVKSLTEATEYYTKLYYQS